MSAPAVLVVDDDDDFRDLVRMVVESAGARVLEAATCVEAIAVLSRERNRVRLVLLDYFIPGMDPSACIRGLLSASAPGTRIVLCTAGVNAAGRAAELGLTRWLAKPFSVQNLEHVVRDAFGGPSPA